MAHLDGVKRTTFDDEVGRIGFVSDPVTSCAASSTCSAWRHGRVTPLALFPGIGDFTATIGRRKTPPLLAGGLQQRLSCSSLKRWKRIIPRAPI